MHVCAASGQEGSGQRRELGSGGITFYMNGQSLDALAFRVVRAACFGSRKPQLPASCTPVLTRTLLDRLQTV